MLNMKKIFSLLCAVFFLSSLAGCGDSSDDSAVDPPGGGGGGEETEELYWNPVIKYSAPDPTCIRAADGTYYLYGTEDTRNMPIYKSDDLVNWTFVGTAFTDATRPKFPTSVSYDDPSLWAPEIRYIKGKYVLFYSLAKWGQEWLSTVGYALSDSPEGPLFLRVMCLPVNKWGFRTPSTSSSGKKMASTICFGAVSTGFISWN